MAELHAALGEMAVSGVQNAKISGGKKISSGGDINRFHQAAELSQCAEYAATIEPLLQEFISRMIEAPVLSESPRGATTGGAAGFLFAANLLVLAPDAFIQPNYGRSVLRRTAAGRRIFRKKEALGPRYNG